MKKLIRNRVNTINSIMWVRGICTKHTGKMEGMTSISTSCKENEFCKKMHQVPGTICEKCFSQTQFEYFPLMGKKYGESTADLTSRLLKFEEIPTIRTTTGAARLESFGELNNTIQVLNYFAICERNPDINFSIWTKRPDLINEVLTVLGKCKPENLNVIWSTLMINGAPEIGKYNFVDGYFTVYTPEYAKKHHIKINCGSKKCIECLECYDAHDGIFIINELLK